MASSQHPRRPREVSEMPIGRYTRLDEIGRGSFATVYQGVHTVSLVFSFVPCRLLVIIMSCFADLLP